MVIFKTMKMRRAIKPIRKCLWLLALGLGMQARAQQGIQFTQYAFSGLTVNPAYAGYKDNWTLNLISRLQWTGIDGAPKTGAISADGITDDRKNVGLGFVVTGDMLGPQTTTSAYVNYAYRLRLDEDDTKRICFGLGFGMTSYVVDYTKFAATDPNDPNLNFGNANKVSPDARLGVYYYTPKFYIGVSALNIFADATFKDNANVVREARCYYLTAGYMVPISSGIDWKPSILIKEDLRGPTNVDLSTNFLISKVLWLGATYRTGVPDWNKAALQNNLKSMDAAAGIVEFYANPNLRIGYSYDFGLTKLAGMQNGTHELSLGLTFGKRKERVINPRYF